MQKPQDQPILPDRAYLNRLLAERNQYPDRAGRIDQLLWQTFGRKVAILALDMCGFSRLTAAHGIIHFLAMIHQMDQAATPAVIGNGGQVIKQEADNLFAIFSSPAPALEAALDIFRAFEAMNVVAPEERDIYGSIGIGNGDTLVIGDEDLFGDEMNAASKLGEDVAGKMEILLTPAAYEALPAAHYLCTAEFAPISGVEFRYRRFEKCLHPRAAGDDSERASP